jgi:hypothetical protein
LEGKLPFTLSVKLLQRLWSWSRGSAPDTGPGGTTAVREPKRDVRLYGRCKIMCPVTLAWQDTEGRTQRMQVRGVDMSGAGACVESSKPVTPGSRVYVQMKDLKLMGGAVVRHCARRGIKYRIGLEFPNPLTSNF